MLNRLLSIVNAVTTPPAPCKTSLHDLKMNFELQMSCTINKPKSVKTVKLMIKKKK